MRYEIKWAEVGQTSTGKTKATLTLVDEKGVETDKVTAWGDFPNFTELQPGKSVNGNISVKVNGQFTNKTLYPEPTAPAWATAGPTGMGKGGGAVKAAEITNKGVATAQIKKDEGVKTSGTMRDAVQIALAELGNLKDHTEYERRILYWRGWLIKNWTIDEPPF